MPNSNNNSDPVINNKSDPIIPIEPMISPAVAAVEREARRVEEQAYRLELETEWAQGWIPVSSLPASRDAVWREVRQLRALIENAGKRLVEIEKTITNDQVDDETTGSKE